MTLTLAILLNVLADVAILGGLAHAMSRPKHLTPHAPAQQAAVSTLEAPAQLPAHLAA
jgi:hypothetical protein